MMKKNILNENQEATKDETSNYEKQISELKRKKKILQNDLNTAKKQLKDQDDVLNFNHSLLKIRTELINTMQDNENSTRNQLKELQNEIVIQNKAHEVCICISLRDQQFL